MLERSSYVKISRYRKAKRTQKPYRKANCRFGLLKIGIDSRKKMDPFVPEALPIASIDWKALIPFIGRANRELAAYAGILETLHNQALLLAPLTTNEAVLSSRIEGTQATFAEVLKFEAGEIPEQAAKKNDIQEVLNYRKALRAAESELSKRPFSLDMLNGLHQTLLSGVRGADKTPGRFRTTQNFIGKDRDTIKEALFIPPAPQFVNDHMQAIEAYYRTDDADPLVQLAVIHAQFEIIHPYMDGNGRLGRILIPLFLFEKKVIPRPMFYLSETLERERAEYVNRLRAIGRLPNAWNSWCEFFLVSVETQARKNANVARAIIQLYSDLKKKVLDLTHSQFGVPLLDQAFSLLVFESRSLKFAARTPTKVAISVLLRKLCAGNVLKVLRQGAGRRSTIYVLPDLMNICEGRKVI